tara:strand:- start:450 stop:944 length:495 start_codon:yes stop_codon:yes gene_type:complete
MKKIIFLTVSIILIITISSCTGYKPIFGSSNLNFKIENYSLKGEKRLANFIYKQFYNISRSKNNNENTKSIILFIETNKEKRGTVKNNAGKVLEYEINLSTNIIINDFLTDKIILNQNFNYSISYKVQDEHSETIKLENKNIENLINKTYEDSLIKISELFSST